MTTVSGTVEVADREATRDGAVSAELTAPGTGLGSAPSSNRLGGHIPVLDGIRGLAILLVFIHHFAVIYPQDAISRFDLKLMEWLHLGRFGVDLFFVLSGFLITGILWESKGSEGYFKTFYARRVLRIFPLYYAVVTFCFLVVPHIPLEKAKALAGTASDQAWYWLYLSNFLVAIKHDFHHRILGVAWSLAIEEQFYLVWPLVVLLCSRRALMWVCSGLIALAFFWRAYLAVTHAHYLVAVVLTPCRVDGLALGAMLSVLMRTGSAAQVVSAAKWGVWAGAAALVGLIVFAGTKDGVDGAYAWPILSGTVFAVLFGSLLVLAVNGNLGLVGSEAEQRGMARRALTAFFASGILRFFGKYSYGLYLLHLPIRALIRDHLFGPGFQGTHPKVVFPVWHAPMGDTMLPGLLVFMLASTLAAVGGALVSWYVLEKPCLSLKRFFPTPSERRPREPRQT
jgi:peptidoglycan/LPS O-acetylase OafA/YrhL